jgi:hypothetical protein
MVSPGGSSLTAPRLEIVPVVSHSRNVSIGPTARTRIVDANAVLRARPVTIEGRTGILA